MNYNSSKNQRIKRKLVEREVIYNVSALVSDLTKIAEELPDYTEDLWNAYRGYPDYTEAAIDHGWHRKEDGTFVDEGGNECEWDVNTWEDLCYELYIDAEEYAPDIYEHWIVTDDFASKLEAHGHRILWDFFGMTIWCRPTTGQAILLDGVVSSIASEMKILKGQEGEWKY